MNRRWVTAFGVLSLSCGVLAIPACGDDTTGGGSQEAGPDSTSGVDAGGGDSAQQVDSGGGGMDSSKPDTSTPSDTGAAPDADAGATCTVFDASGLDDASVAAGFQVVWQVYKCQGCHQKTSQKVDDAGMGIVLSGNNDGIGDSGMVFPPNLTNDPTTGLGCWTDQQVQDAILKGADPEGGTLCPPMAKYGNALTTADGGPRPGTPMDAGTVKEIVDFLRSLPPVTNQVMDTTCPAADGGDAATDAPAADATGD